jgi:glutathione S-transferase
MAQSVLTVSSKNYSSWSLRGWLLCKMSGIDFVERKVPMDDAATRAELLLLSPSFLVPCLEDGDAKVWDTLAIAEYLHETRPEAGLYPVDRRARAHCRAIAGEMHAGFFNLRSALPMNLKARYSGFRIWSGAQPDIARIGEIWRECLETYGGPYLFGGSLTVADAMYAPACTRFHTYDVPLDTRCATYRDTILAWPAMVEWTKAALDEADDLEELDVEF